MPQMEAIRVPAGQKRLARTEAPATRIVSYNILADMYATSDYSLVRTALLRFGHRPDACR